MAASISVSSTSGSSSTGGGPSTKLRAGGIRGLMCYWRIINWNHKKRKRHIVMKSLLPKMLRERSSTRSAVARKGSGETRPASNGRPEQKSKNAEITLVTMNRKIVTSETAPLNSKLLSVGNTMYRNRLKAASLLLCMLAFTVYAKEEAQDTTPQQHFPSSPEIQALVQARVDENRAGGIMVGVMEADGSTRIFSAGDPGPGAQPFGPRSVFEIGSITKVFTGILLADMVARGEVSFDDPIAKYLPEDEVTIPTRGGREITLLDISTHRSALPRIPDNFAPADDSNPYADYTVEQMYEFLSGHQLRRDIGAEVEYSNLAVGLLGHALAQTHGGSYEELVRERILEPLGMNHTSITLNEDMQYRLAKGHDREGNVVSNWNIPTLAGAGALRSDMTDMLKFIAANTGPAETSLEEAMRESHQARNSFGGPNDIGLNWIIFNQGEDKIVWHNGGTGGYRTFAGFDPDRGVGAVVLTNSNHGSDDIGMHLINANIPLTPPPKEHVEIEVPATTLRRYEGVYQLMPKITNTIRFTDGQLTAQITGQDILPVFAESERKFFLKIVDAQLEFFTDELGRVTHVNLYQGGRTTKADRISDAVEDYEAQ